MQIKKFLWYDVLVFQLYQNQRIPQNWNVKTIFTSHYSYGQQPDVTIGK